jgi:4-amino-4-deoxy-L-arabinose transferase-like glycosyltransferase
VLRFSPFLIIFAWALLYLPGLGTRELQGEEARRVLPGRTMLQTGDFMVPRSGGRVYNRKPPLTNWVSAAAITLTGRMNEWTVRLPSTLVLLALALVAWFALKGWLGEPTALLTALILLTNIGFLEKGRLIEIEALYFCLYGMALLCWLTMSSPC